MRKADDILDYCIKNLKGTVLIETWGEKAVFYNPGNILKKGVYVLTIKEKDGENDKASGLDRKDIFRVNLGLRKEAFIKLFGEIPARPAAGAVVDMNYDFKKTDEISHEYTLKEWENRPFIYKFMQPALNMFSTLV